MQIRGQTIRSSRITQNTHSPQFRGNNDDEFYAMHLQPTALMQLEEKYGKEPVQVLDWFTTDEKEKKLLNRLEQQSPSAEQFIRVMDNPQDRVRTIPFQQWFFPESSELNLDKPNGGWLAQLFEVIGLSPQWKKHLEGRKGVELFPHGKQIRFQSVDPVLLQKRVQQEGFADLGQVKDQWRGLFKIKSDYLKEAPNELAGRIRYVEAIQKALKTNKPLTSSQQSQPIHRYLLMRELLKQMTYLHNASLTEDTEQAQQYREALNTLRLKYGLEFLSKEPTIIGRHMKGMVLWNRDLGLIIKQPGDLASHTIMHTESHLAPYIDPIGKNEAILHGPKAIDGGRVFTARAQIAQRIEQNIEVLSRILGMPTEYSLISGIETQQIIEGKTLKELFADNPDLLTRDVVEQMVLFQLIMEKLGLELTDWSLNNFMVSADAETGKTQLRLVDLGGFERLPEEKRTPQGEEERRQRIANIGHSASNHQKLIQSKMAQYVRAIETQDLDSLKQKADELFAHYSMPEQKVQLGN